MKNWALTFLSIVLTAPTFLLADTPTTPAAPAQDGFMQTLVMITIALLFFYLILWRPEQKRRKEADKLREGLKKGDRVTAMGIIGTVSKVNDQTVILRMVDGSKVEMLKMAISEILPSEEGDKPINDD